ncbi:MAG: Fic family protein [Desulfobacteraceae bacterium]|nr:MAG: Fic family protein [Desulfobacteraceae bacterium]
MKRGPSGEYVLISTVGDEPVRAFVPRPLPPDPPLQIEYNLREMLDEALLSLGRLDSVSTLLPDTNLFIYLYVRKEAVLSSQIEGTQSSLSDLLLFELDEAPGVPLNDVVEVSNYVAALDHGIRRLKEDFPISSRLIREIHEILLARGRGEDKNPGEFRRSQNWIGWTRPGNASFVPPPPHQIPEIMSSFERFLHGDPDKTPVLLKAAMAHVQFETIHPFLDGNGRVGRLLIPLLFHAEGVLREPLLYLSLYFKKHRSTYYDLLNRVRTEGDWEGWLVFFAEGVRDMAENAVRTAQRLVQVGSEDHDRIRRIGRLAGSCMQIHHALQRRPVSTVAQLSKETGLSVPTVTSGLHKLQEYGLVREITGRQRNRVFSYVRYLDILMEETGE